MKKLFKQSPPKRQISPNRHINPRDPSHNYSPPHKSSTQTLQSKKYYCHYINGVYMGGMDCYKKLGHGILLVDSGACAITCHSHDNMINHNVIFRDRSMTSLLININRTKSLCFRTGPFLLGLNLTSKDKIQGIGYFIHYSHRKLFKLKFDANGSLTVKQRITDDLILKKIFQQNNLTQLFHDSHVKAMKLQFDLPQQIIHLKSESSKMIFGFKKQDQRQPKINGLFFKIFVKELLYDFDVILEQRGYLQNEQINYFGQKHFNNGNYYIGEFKDGKYNGRGVLIYPKEKKWTYGDYFNGELQKVIDSDVINTTNSGCPQAIKNVHEYSKTFLQHKIDLRPSQKWLYTLLKIVDQKDPYEHESIDYTKKQRQKQNNLNIVQEDFTSRKYQNRTQQAIKDLLSDSKAKQQKQMEKAGNQKNIAISKLIQSPKGKITHQDIKKRTKSKQKQKSAGKSFIFSTSPIKNRQKSKGQKQTTPKKQSNSKQINAISSKTQENQPQIKHKIDSSINQFANDLFKPKRDTSAYYSPKKYKQNNRPYFNDYSYQKYPNLVDHNRSYSPINSNKATPDYILPRITTDFVNLYRPSYLEKEPEIKSSVNSALYPTSYPKSYYPYQYQPHQPIGIGNRYTNPEYIHPLDKYPVRSYSNYYKYLDDDQDFNAFNRRLSNDRYRSYFNR